MLGWVSPTTSFPGSLRKLRNLYLTKKTNNFVMSKPNTRAIIDASIRQNGQQLITGQVLNSVLNSMVTDYAEQAALDAFKEKVDALALGAFYGYFPDSSSLPVDMTTPGYAYVGLDNPYKIWNFNGKSWSDSGTSIDMNDADEEDITRNADGKLQFKDRAYGDGMGYIILRKNKIFAEQVTQSNTIYEIRYVFDLGGASVTIPAGCTLKFVGGKLSNGTITGNTTIISGTPSFANVAFAGTFDLRYIDAKWFDYTNSAEKIDAVFRLATSVTKGNIVVNLEAGVTYDLDYALHTSAIIISAKWSFNSVNNIIINGNGATLHHINPISDIPSDQTLDGILLFYNCRNVIVTGLKYISDVGAQVYTASTAPKGCTFIKIQGYGSNYNIDIEAEYAAYAVNQSLFPLSALERVGLITGSRFHIIANKSRYGFASSWMQDCDIYVHSEGNHRACYLSGASRCKVRVETSESYVAPHPCLLQQSRVLDEGGNVKYLFNSDIDISVTYVGSGNNPSTIYLVGFGSYGKELYEITTRPAIHSKNIRISVNIPVDTTNVYGVAMLYSEETDYIAAGDTFDNISVYVDCFSNATTGFYWISPNDVAFNNFNVVLVNGNATLYCGTLTKITFKNSSISTLNMAGADIILDNSRVNAASLLVSTQGNQNNTKKVRYINGGGMAAISGTDAAGRIIFKLGDYEYVDYWQVQNKIDVNSDHIIIIDNTGNPLMWKSAGWEHLATIASKGTAYRPVSGIYPGYLYFDTDLKKMILWNGSAWTNIDGTALG